MNPNLLALRYVLQRRALGVGAVLVIAAGLAGLDLLAGHSAAALARLEHQAVVGERLGHLTILRNSMAGEGNGEPAPSIFSPLEVARVKQITAAGTGMTLVFPQLRVRGSARALARIDRSGARGLAPPLKPFEPDPSSNERTERLTVNLADPAQLEERRDALQAALDSGGIHADVKTWQEMSDSYAEARRTADLWFAYGLGIVLTLAGATIAAATAINVFERKNEVATLRALGMKGKGIVMLFVGEALWMAVIGIALSVAATGVITWIVNRAGLPTLAPDSLQRAPALVEPDYQRMLLAAAALVLLALLAALVPALKAAHGRVAETLTSSA